jgi:hypothetical protein
MVRHSKPRPKSKASSLMVSPPASRSRGSETIKPDASDGEPCATNTSVSQSEFAELRGVNRSQVTRWLAYTPPLPHEEVGGRKRILVKEGNDWVVGVLQSRPTAGKQKALKDKPPSIEHRLAQLKLQEAELSMAMRQAKYDEQMGKLVARDAVQKSFEKGLSLIRQKIMESPLRFAAEIASESGGEQVAIRVTLDRLMRQTLSELSAGMAKIGL